MPGAVGQIAADGVCALPPPAGTTPSGLFPLSWSHYVRLLSVESHNARAFYEAEAVRGGWSNRQRCGRAGRQGVQI